MALQYRFDIQTYDLLLHCDEKDCPQMVSGSMIARDLVANMYLPRGWDMYHGSTAYNIIGDVIAEGIPGNEVEVFCPAHHRPNTDTNAADLIEDSETTEGDEQ